MQKIIKNLCMLLVLLMAFALTACASKTGEPKPHHNQEEINSEEEPEWKKHIKNPLDYYKSRPKAEDFPFDIFYDKCC